MARIHPASCGLGLTWQRLRNLRHYCSDAHVKFKAREVRRLFLDYFTKDHDHQYVASSSVLPSSDKSILFTNAGMNQFKSVFLGTLEPNSPLYNVRRAANYQKCVRVGGKHNDLEDVGKDLHHHTFFEMLGNWSFGDYFKKEACSMAWELLTKVYHLPKSRLYVTYFSGDKELGLPPDEECRQAWLELGLPPARILPFGMKDNFWEMGDVGPCGPSTEIHIDLASQREPSMPAQLCVNAGFNDMVELWNLVFIQFNRARGGTLSALPKKHVDTGMGLERLAAVLQNAKSNYDTDLFSPLLMALEKMARVPSYKGAVGPDCTIDASYRVVVDHARMFTVAISDGVLPDHVDAGNKLRRIIRKASHVAIRHLKCDQGALASLADNVYAILGDVYPNIDVELVKSVVNSEEDKYLLQMSKAEAALKKSKPSKEIAGRLAWEMYVQYGLQKEIIADIAAERGLSVNWKEFNELLREFQEKSNARKECPFPGMLDLGPEAKHLAEAGVAPTDTFGIYDYASSNGSYDFPTIMSVIRGIFSTGKEVHSASHGESCLIVTDATNFYFESGGQVSDKGKIITKNGEFSVNHVEMHSGFVFHHGIVTAGSLHKNDIGEMCIDKEHRTQCMLHHTATHCLHAALRTVLGSTQQKSSLVDNKHLRFDFLSEKNLTNDQLNRVQTLCNAMIKTNHMVQRNIMLKSEAMKLPQLVTTANEVHPTSVSVITIGKDEDVVSRELCCGTHVSSLSDLSEIVLLSHRSVTAVVRSLSAVAGPLTENVKALDNYIEREMCALVESTAALHQLPLDDYLSMATCKEKLLEIRRFVAQNPVSLLLQRNTEARLEKLEREISSMLKKYNNAYGLQKVSVQLDAAVERWKETPFLVACLELCTEGTAVSKLVFKTCRYKPYLTAVFTNTNQLQIDCFVPKTFLSKTFQADAWIRAIEPHVKSYSCTSNKFNTLETYCNVKATLDGLNLKGLETAAIDFANKHCVESTKSEQLLP